MLLLNSLGEYKLSSTAVYDKHIQYFDSLQETSPTEVVFRDKKLTPHTVAVYWPATKSYPKSEKKKAEQLHADVAKASTQTDEPAESSGDEQKETPEPIATSRSTILIPIII